MLHSRLLAGFIGLCLSSAPALAQSNVSLENLTWRDNETKTTVTVARVDVANTNLSRAEIVKLFSGGIAAAEAAPLAARLSADSLTVSGVTLTSEDGKISFGPVRASGIRQGRFSTLKFDGFTGSFAATSGAGGGTLSARALTMEAGNFAPLLGALQGGDVDASAFQVGRLVFDGFEGSFTDSETPAGSPGGNQIKFALRSLSMTTEFASDKPVATRIEAAGFTFDPAPASEAGKALRSFGYERIDLGVSGAGRYDPASQKLSVQDYAITAAQAGRLGLSAELSGVDAAALSSTDTGQRALAMLGASVESLKIDFVNEGLVEKSFAYAAAKQGRSPAALRTEMSNMSAQLLPLLLGGDPQSLSLAQSLQSFLVSPRNFSLSLQARGAPLPIARLGAIRDPATFLALVNVTLAVNR